MEKINGNYIFWFICLGLMVGSIAKMFFGSKGRSLAANVIGGALWAVMTGIIAEIFGLYGSIAFATMGTTAFLILFNVFSLLDDRTSLKEDHTPKQHTG